MAKYHAFGAKLQIKDTTFKDVAGVRDISGPGMSADTVDVTTHDSTDAWEEYLKGTKNPGELSFDLVWDPTETAMQAELLTAMASDPDDDPEEFRVIFNTATAKIWEFKGYVTSFEPSLPVKGEVSASVTIKITGKPNFAAT